MSLNGPESKPLTPAEQWAKQNVEKYPWTEDELCWIFQQVQADVLRHVAGRIHNNGSGSQQWLAGELEEQAKTLEERI